MEQPCHHGYTQAPSLSPDPSLSVCAVCSTQARISDVKVVQAALTRRGGVFDSPNAGPDLFASGRNVKDLMTHRDWTKLWRRTRLNCWRLVAKLEKLRDERSDMVEKWGIDEALYIWELAKDECSRVPGCGAVEGSISSTEREMPQSHDTQDFLETSHTKKEPSEGDWETVKRRLKKMSQPPKSSLQDEPEQADAHEVVLKEMEGVNNRLKHLGFASQNRFEALANGSKNVTSAAAKPIKKRRRVLGTDALPVQVHSLQETTTSKLRSALKRTSSSPSQSRKHVVISAQATILPSDTTAATTMSHNEHTIAEKKHTQLSYNRNSHFYTPSYWASPEGYEKENTSFQRDTWVTVDQLQKTFETSEEALGEESNEKAQEAVTKEEKKAEGAKFPRTSLSNIAAAVAFWT